MGENKKIKSKQDQDQSSKAKQLLVVVLFVLKMTTGSASSIEMLNRHLKLLCKLDISVITYEMINRKDELREVILTDHGGVVNGTADTKIPLHQNT